ncbi:hypothetical protein LSAT2_030784, partial [Lamellibrachia satsuma]
MDDILVFGETQNQIVQVSTSGPFSEDFIVQVTLNEKKCKFSLPEVEFLGQIINKSGVSPDPEKVKAIQIPRKSRQYMPEPTDVSGVRPLLRMVISQMG